MFWDTGQATKHTTRVGEKSKSNSAHPEDCPLSLSSQKPGITPRATDRLRRLLSFTLIASTGLAAVVVASAHAQSPDQDPLTPKNNQPAPPGQQNPGAVLKVDVNLVVLHTTVLDDRGRFVDGLKQENFRVLEDKVEQKMSVFKREDVPVSMGLVIDNSGSMRDKRPRVNEAALTLVQTSNPQDEAFVVNFNDDYLHSFPTRRSSDLKSVV